MPEFVPLYTPGQSVTRTASAAITGGQLLVVSGSGSVAPSAAASGAWFGVAGHDAVSGDPVTVRKGGVARLTAAGAVTAGDLLVAASNGRVATNAAPGAGQQVGVALTTAADAALVEVDLVR